MSIAPLVLFAISMNSSLPPAGPRKRNSLITIGVATVPRPVSAAAVDAPPVVDTVNVPRRAPPTTGAKVTGAVVDAPGTRVVAAAAPTAKRAASTPLMVSDASTIGVALTLVIVTVCVAAEPAATRPKSIVPGAAVMTTGGAVMVTVKEPRPVQPLAAVACTLKVNGPAAVGVPASTPPLPRVRPAGTAPPASEKVYGASPPDALTAAE